MKKTYNYDEKTKEYLKETTTDIDPRKTKQNKKVCYFFTPNSTFIKPPQTKTNEIAIFNEDNNKWDVKKDFRGDYYNQDEQIISIKEIGIEKSNSFLTEQEFLKKQKTEFENYKQSYVYKRKKEYPPIEDFIDAQVKKAASDANLFEEGLIQEEEYFQKCLLVKEKYPKI
jgi:hypothetical protein